MNDLTEGELLALPFLFEFWAMEHQLPPDGDWRSWVIMGGRGAGKTRAGAEWVRSQVEGAMPLDEGRAKRVALVGETIEQVREVMIFGDSGILACSPPDRKPAWEAGRKRLVWPNGAIATVHSAFDPEGLRGPQFDAAWVDEMGCSAVDKGTNEPNKFVDAKSSESSLPRYSNGARDDFIQAQYLKAVISFWNDPQENPVSPEYEAPMVNMDRAFVWAWDARPYPYFPNNEALWSDARNYARGHWLNGRSSSRSLASVVTEICSKSGLSAIDTSGLYGQVRGFTVSDVADARSALQPLMLRYSFDAIERDGLLVFRMRNGSGAVDVNADHLALSTELEGVVEQTRDPEASIAGRVRLRFMQADASFDVLSEEAVLADEQTHSVSTTEVPIALTRTEGRQVAERWLSEARMARDRVRIALPPSQLGLGAGDIIRLAGEQNEGQGTYRIDRLEQGMLQIADAVRIDGSVYVASDLEDEVVSPPLFVPPAPVYAQFLDLPLMTGNEEPHAPFFAASAQPWPGSVALYQSSSDSDFRLLDTFAGRAIIGFTQDRLLEAPSGRLDRGPALRVKLMSGALSSVDEQAFLSGANLAAIGNGTADDWEIFQFQKATLVAPDTYDLSLRLRGQFGTDALSPNEWPSGSVFVLLNGVPEQISLLRNSLRVAQTYRIGPAKRPVADPSYTQSVEAFAGNGLRPYSPVHLSPLTHSDGGLELSWIRRTRIDGDGWDGLEVPLGEEAESYFVRVRKAGTIIREETVSQSNWVYPLSAQATDGATGECTLEVAQISATFGPGPFARLIVTL